jgi:hypothetical protein
MRPSAKNCRILWTATPKSFRTDDFAGRRSLSSHCAPAIRTSHFAIRGKRFNTDLLEAVELASLPDLAEVVVDSARSRKKAARPMREDYPERDDKNWKCAHDGLPGR